MQINKFTKKKNGMYNIVLEDGSEFLAYEDIILKYDLLLKKNLSSDEKEKILQENLIYISYDLAIKYISIKMRTEKEIKEYLITKNIDKIIIDKTIEMLKKSKYIDDNAYTIAYINNRITLSNDGPNKIIKELINKGINENIALSKISQFTEEIQLEKIKKITEKIINTNRNKSSNALKSKITEYLVNLGYNKSFIIEHLNQQDLHDDEKIAKKEYDKIAKKLSKKYSGKELEYKIKQKLYSLGFQNYDID